MMTGLLLLSDWMRRLLGLSPDVERRLNEAQFYLASPWPLRWAVVFLGVAALWFGYLYLVDGRRPSLWLKIPLLVLRLTALAALLLMLLQPMLRLHRSDRMRSTVAVLLDDSQSMGFRDPRLSGERAAHAGRAVGGSAAGLTRAQVVERAVNQAKLVGVLAKRYNVRVYRFATDTRPEPLPADTKKLAAYRLKLPLDDKRGNSTQMGTALNRVLEDISGQRVSGALILSDGGSNLGDDPAAVAERAKAQGLRVSAVGIGDPTPTRDLAITEVLADEVVRKDNVVQVFAGIAHRGYEGRTVAVTLRKGAETVGTQSIKLGPAARKQSVTFTYTPKQVGAFTYTVSTSVLPEEVTDKNNRRTFLQRVVDKQLKLLYVEGEPRWEYRYLKNAILRDKQIRFSCILVTGASSRSGGEGNVPIYGFPSDEKSLFEYDILILGDVPRTYFNDAQVRNIRRFVEDRGGSLVVIAGEKHMPHEYKGSSLDAVFPVALLPYPEQVTTGEPFQLKRTESGLQDPIMRMSDDAAENERIWGELPGIFWNAGVERAKPGATVLAVNPLRSNANGKRVIVAVQNFGAGKCFITLTDSTWRWRWRVGDRHFYRFWGQVIRTLTPKEPPGGNRFVQLNADRTEYILGDRVSVHARILDAFYRPVKAPKVTASLRGETGGARQIVLTAIPGSPGLYSTDFLAERTGKFELGLPSPANPAAKASTAFLVQSIALESQQPEMNEALLKKVAAAGGGQYYFPDELRKWIDSLKANDFTVRSESEHELWDAPLILILFILPITLEWIIRKRTGMM